MGKETVSDHTPLSLHLFWCRLIKRKGTKGNYKKRIKKKPDIKKQDSGTIKCRFKHCTMSSWKKQNGTEFGRVHKREICHTGTLNSYLKTNLLANLHCTFILKQERLSYPAQSTYSILHPQYFLLTDSLLNIFPRGHISSVYGFPLGHTW